MREKFPMVAKTFQGLEDVLRDELIALGAENVEMGVRMVTFEGDLEMLYKANFCCRTALRILKPISKFTATNPDELYDFVREFEWDQYLTPQKTFAIDSTVNSNEFTHSRFVTYRVKDGIVDYFNDKYGQRPSIRLSGADVCLNVHIFEDRVTISLDSSGESLNKRGYRVATTEAPINEVLAAGLIIKTGWHGESDFVDPMCGSGTFLIEAALIAANIYPGVYRKHYAFENWADFDKDLFEEIYNDDSKEREYAGKIYGGDISVAAIEATKKNIKMARVDNMIDVACKPFSAWEKVSEKGILITNPPYGERIVPSDIEALYASIGSKLKNTFKGFNAWIIGYKDEHFHQIGLKPSVKFPILNGNLECEFREYVLFDGSYAEFKTGGGSVHNEEFNREVKPKVRHMSDEEWESETRKYNNGKERKVRESRKESRNNMKRDERRFDSRRRNDYEKGERRENNREEKSWKKSVENVHKSREGIRIIGKSPRLPESSATIFSKTPIRSRKGWRKVIPSDEVEE